MVAATGGCRWIFLARPWPGSAPLQAHLDIQQEKLEGFSLQDIASEFRAQNAPINAPSAERVRRVTGGLPLFVRDAARLTAQRYSADANAFCDAVESRTNPYVNGQDVIVRDVITHVAAGAVDELAAAELENQRQLVERIAAGRRSLRRLPPPPGAGPLPAEFHELPERDRNDQCFCDSGLKYKQCCGRQDA